MAVRTTTGFAAAFTRLLARWPWSAQGRRRAALARAGGARAADALEAMDWQEFEQLVGEGFRLQGFDVREHGRGVAGGAADLILGRGQELFYVQCKQWRAIKVGVDVVRELHGLITARGAAGGFVVTSGHFTDAAKEFAEGRNVRLVDGRRLLGLIQHARDSISGAGASDLWVETRWPAS